MNRGAILFGCALLGLAAGCSRGDSGTEFTFRVAFPKDYVGDRRAETERTLEILARRAALMRRDAEGRVEGDDIVVFRVFGPEWTGWTRVLSSVGKLEISPTAPREIQERFNKDQVVSEGYRVIENPDPRNDPEYQAWGARILVQKASVIERCQIVRAEPRQEMVPGGSRWVTDFELDGDGAKRFDEAAAALYQRQPPGLVAIILDGKVQSLPAIMSPSFHGRGQISGAKDESDARDLSIILGSGALPHPVYFKSGRPFGPAKK